MTSFFRGYLLGTCYSQHPKYLCRSVKSVGEYTQQEVLCKSVKSVGGHSWRRGYGKMPYPPKEESAGGHIIKL